MLSYVPTLEYRIQTTFKSIFEAPFKVVSYVKKKTLEKEFASEGALVTKLFAQRCRTSPFKLLMKVYFRFLILTGIGLRWQNFM